MVDRQDELLSRTLYEAARMQKREDQLRTASDFRTRVAKCTKDEGEIFEHLL